LRKDLQSSSNVDKHKASVAAGAAPEAALLNLADTIGKTICAICGGYD